MTVIKKYDEDAEAWQTIVVGKQGPSGVVTALTPLTYDGPSQTVGIDPAGYVAELNGLSGTVTLGPSDVGAIGTAFGLYVEDYSTAPSVRPSAAAVYWRGTAAPGTAVALPGDLWYDTTGDA